MLFRKNSLDYGSGQANTFFGREKLSISGGKQEAESVGLSFLPAKGISHVTISGNVIHKWNVKWNDEKRRN